MRKFILAVLSAALLLSAVLYGGTASAQTAGITTCAQAQTHLANQQAGLREASATDSVQQGSLAALKRERATAASRGGVERVGQLNVQIGSASGYASTTESSKILFQARVVRAQGERDTLCR